MIDDIVARYCRKDLIFIRKIPNELLNSLRGICGDMSIEDRYRMPSFC